jgi:hypothetical protein
LEDKNGRAFCKVYNGKRLLVCKVFPINNMDLADRNRVAPSRPCGFYWSGRKKLACGDATAVPQTRKRQHA